MIAKAKTSVVYDNIDYAFRKGYKYISLEGGTRSTKTYSTLQYAINSIAFSEPKLEIFRIFRKEFATTKETVMLDFIDILQSQKLYDEKKWKDKTLSGASYRVGNLVFKFIGVDKSEKKQGSKSKYSYCNEVLDLSLEEFMQIGLRTTGTIFCDYNPKYTKHWYYDQIETLSTCKRYHSTIFDNAFLDEDYVNSVIELAKTDQHYFDVYIKGLRADAGEIIYPAYSLIDEMPAKSEFNLHGYGADFGEVNPTAVVQAGIKGNNLYLDECLYKSHMTDSELVYHIKEAGITASDVICCDSAAPDKIKVLNTAGFNAHKSDKSVLAGIRAVKNYHIHITKRSKNLLMERSGYKWKTTRQGILLDEPIKINDHLLDAARYIVNEMHKIINQSRVI